MSIGTFREWLREGKINEAELKVKSSPKLNKIEINGVQYSPAAAIEKYIEFTKISVEDSFRKLKIGEFINKKTNNKYTVSDFNYLNESSDGYDSEEKLDLNENIGGWDSVQDLDATIYIKDKETNEMFFIKTDKVSDLKKFTDALTVVSPWENIAGEEVLKSFSDISSEITKKSKLKIKIKKG